MRLFPSILEWLAGIAVAGGFVLYWLNSASGTGTILKVEDHQITALVDAFSGEVVVDDTPGFRLIRPFIEDAYSVVKSPVEYAMTDNKWENDNLVPRLSVRAADGSTVWFEDVRIQYGVLTDRAWDVMRDSGGDYAWRHGIMDAYARTALRAAFGRFTAEEVVRQDNLRAARFEAKERLTSVLKRHGLTVLELSTSSPAFPKEYESVVQRRQVAEQERLKIDQELVQLRASKEDRIAKLNRDKALEGKKMRSKVAKDLSAAKRTALQRRNGADKDFSSRLNAGTRELEEMESRADALVAKYTGEAEGLKEQADALAAKGLMAVRRALVDGLANVKFEIAPFDSPGEGLRRARNGGGIVTKTSNH